MKRRAQWLINKDKQEKLYKKYKWAIIWWWVRDRNNILVREWNTIKDYYSDKTGIVRYDMWKWMYVIDWLDYRLEQSSMYTII